MKRLNLMTAALAVAATALVTPAFAKTYTFNTLVDAAQEVPVPIPSGAVGEATIVVDTMAKNFDFQLEVIGLDLADLFDIPNLGPVHLHRGVPGARGPIVAPFGPLAGPNFSDAFPFDAAAVGTIKGFSVTVDDFAFDTDAEFGSFFDDLSKGGIYVNVHSLVNRPGDIRGNFDPLPAVPLPASSLLLLSGIGGLIGLRRRKKA